MEQIIETIMANSTLSIGKPSDEAFSNLMPCVNGIKSATFCKDTGKTS